MEAPKNKPTERQSRTETRIIVDNRPFRSLPPPAPRTLIHHCGLDHGGVQTTSALATPSGSLPGPGILIPPSVTRRTMCTPAQQKEPAAH